MGGGVGDAIAGENGPGPQVQEPNADIACGWFPDFTKRPGVGVWTPVGWKDHNWLFNVLQDGSVTPASGAVSKAGLFLLSPSADGSFASILPSDQGWKDCQAPVLWTKWGPKGLPLRYEFFAHLLGGQDAAKGCEPLFGWLRFSSGNVQGESKQGRYGFALKSPLRGKPSAVPEGPLPEGGWRLTDDTGKVLLGIPGGQHVHFAFTPGKPTEKESTLFIRLDSRQSSHVDFILPAFETEQTAYDQEMKLGFDGALKETNAFWSRIPATAACVDTPEPFVNRTIQQNLKFREIITKRDTKTGDYCMTTGSNDYRACWAEDLTHESIWLLEWMGYHSVNEKYLRVFLRSQGASAPPGPAYKPHGGNFGNPRFASCFDWISDHGALLYNVCTHALLTRDEQFIRDHTGAIVKACDFIKDARALKHDGIQGLLPVARSNDSVIAQGIWGDGWNYKGLITAVRLLRKMHHPRAEEFANDAQNYREAIVQAIRKVTASMPPFKHNGKEIPFVPSYLYPPETRTNMTYWFDTGVVSLVFMGVLCADDPLIEAALDYAHIKGMLQHEFLLEEPDYSWDMFCWHAAGDRAAFWKACMVCSVSASRERPSLQQKGPQPG